jgi:transcriptional regulator with XRE-family HTH domain
MKEIKILYNSIMRRKKLTKTALKKAIAGSSGLVSNVAQRLNVSRTTVRKYLAEDNELQELMFDELENILDFAESKLIKKVHEEDLGAIKYLLSSKGKKRGFGNKDYINEFENNDPKKLPSWLVPMDDSNKHYNDCNTIHVKFEDFSGRKSAELDDLERL